MQFNKPLLAAGLLMSLTTLTAEAALTSYIGADGAGLVYSSVSNVTWTQDANLFKTLYDTNNNLVNLITVVTPSYNDPGWGFQELGDGGTYDDFDIATGRLSWWGAKAFVSYLNSINYGGSAQWRLPNVIVGSNLQGGYNQTGSELGQLFYNELDGTAHRNIPITSSFNNVQVFDYWFGTESDYESLPRYSWSFGTASGSLLNSGSKNFQAYAWAVSPGQVAAVPIPAAVWLFCTVLVGWLGLNKL